MTDLRACAFTVDVEDAVNQAMRNYFHRDMKPTVRVCDNTLRLLDLLSEHSTKATFFILGEVAETFPELIAEIAKRGHELGIHGYSHARYFNLSKKEVLNEIVRTKQLVESISGHGVIGHRAPEFSVNRETSWVLDLLLDAGIKYDSSIFPVKADRYGWSDFNKNIGYYELSNNRKLIEAPLSVVSYFGKDFPACGGGYMRAFPYYCTNYAFQKIMKVRPVILYMHPYEIDQPPFQGFYMEAMQTSSIKTKIQLKKYWYNRSTVIPKLGKLLSTYRFTTLRNVISETLNIEV